MKKMSHPLQHKKILITAGPTRERLDPVRFISNYSSGKQGYAIAAAFAHAGAEVILVSGPVQIPAPKGVTVIAVESADEMQRACQQALPVDVAICTAAVCDWKAASIAPQKLKKSKDNNRMTVELEKNPDILAMLSVHPKHRPALVVGFAAETEYVMEHAQRKRAEKQCDWILANDVSPEAGVFGSDHTHIIFISPDTQEDWGRTSKEQVAQRLVDRVVL